MGDNAMVNDLLLPSGGWDTQKLNENFLQCDVDDILRILIRASNYRDMIIWQFEGSGVYSVKSGYWLERESMARIGTLTSSLSLQWWRKLWKLYMPLKIKIFIWRACHDWILTLSNLRNRGMSMNRNCLVCNQAEKSTFHALLMCGKAKEVRREWMVMKTMNYKACCNFFDLITDMAKHTNTKENLVLFCIICWKLWCLHNLCTKG
ncbi:hypothetical protein Ddye_029089 [Dipteronia dyeriana]|uniref:Reverse transcriptase zinc-binding domain-containing protein n=1 Tax=Dipteronia dyeriana TaxID=168575 RepID=A0AAD9TDX3_9ROSI|nr:hypothetical protein Ddye_029089 [Dipteronia dyeriana]